MHNNNITMLAGGFKSESELTVLWWFKVVPVLQHLIVKAQQVNGDLELASVILTRTYTKDSRSASYYCRSNKGL